MKKNSFLTGAAILAGAGIFCRLLGLIFRIPLANIVGNFGMGLYQMVFPIYALLLIVSSAGIPIAISKMVAKESTAGNHDECKRILRASIYLLAVIGLFFAIALFLLSGPIANLQGNEKVQKIYFAIAPSIFIVCIISAFRGYFQGLQNMIPTATSQIIEQVFKVGFGLTLAVILAPISPEWAVFGAITAISISEVFALVFLLIVYMKHKKGQSTADGASPLQEGRVKKAFAPRKGDAGLALNILRQSLPVTAMAAVFPLILVFDSLVVIRLLQAAGESNKAATQLFGISTGTVHTLINMPATLAIAIATAVVPTVSSLLKQKKIEELRTKCALAVKIIVLIALFFMFFYIAFSSRVINLLYESAFKDNQEHFRIATWLLRIEATMIVLMAISAVFAAMMQGASKARYPLIAIAAGGAVKIILQLILIPTSVGIFAVSIGNVVCFAIAGALNTWFALRIFKIKGNLTRIWWRLIVLVGVYIALLIVIALVMPDGKWWIVLGGAVAFAVYVALVWVLKIFSREERKSILGSEK